MNCTRPRIVYDGNFRSEYPCGKCPACRRARTREWANRIVHELGYWDKSCFLTLTYDNEHLPEMLDKRQLQLFIKRMRKAVEPVKIKYFACGEYGELYHRPHYHLIVFGIAKDDPFFIFKNQVAGKNYFTCDQWPYGFIDVGSVTYKSAAYVAGYIQKKLGKEAYGKKTPPFQIQSQGIGRRYVDDNLRQLVSNVGFTMNGTKCSLPRYYRKVLGDKIEQEVLNDLAVQRVDELDEFLEKSGYHPIDDRMEYKAGIKRLKELELAQLRERNKPRSF